jgi:hypothetical protein
VRLRTPEDTVLIAPATYLPLAALTERSEYIGLWESVVRPGYDETARAWLVDVLGVPARSFRERERIHREIYAERRSPGFYAERVESLSRLGRPVAIRFASQQSAVLRELRKQRLGEEVFANSGGLVWLIHFAAARAPGAQRVELDEG